MTAPDAPVPVGALLGEQLQALQEPLLRANPPGNRDGLLAHHLLSGRHLGFVWNVDPLTPTSRGTWIARPGGVQLLGPVIVQHDSGTDGEPPAPQHPVPLRGERNGCFA